MFKNLILSAQVAAPSRDVALEWGESIRDTAASANDRDIRQREQERSMRVAMEISSLIIYCKSVAFDKERFRNGVFDFTEMSSFPENKAEKIMCSMELKFFLKYHQVNFTLFCFAKLTYIPNFAAPNQQGLSKGSKTGLV